MVNPNYALINTATQEEDADSVLHFYRALIALRNKTRTLQYGAYRPLWTEHTQIFAYERELDGETFTIICNMSGEPALLPESLSGAVVLSNAFSSIARTMLPYEARVIVQTK